MKLTRILTATALSIGLSGLVSTSVFAYHYGRGRLGNYYAGAGWRGAVTVYGDYLRGLATLRLATARAAYDLARARQENAKAAALSRLIDTLNKDLSQLEYRLTKVRPLVNRIETNMLHLTPLLQGRVSTNAKMAVNYFLQFGSSTAVELFETEVPGFAADDFELVEKVRRTVDPQTREVKEEEITLEPFAGGNMFEFIAWLAPYALKVRPGSPAHRALVDLRAKVLEAGDQWLAAVEQKVQDLEDRKVDIWAPTGASIIGALPARSSPYVE